VGEGTRGVSASVEIVTGLGFVVVGAIWQEHKNGIIRVIIGNDMGLKKASLEIQFVSVETTNFQSGNFIFQSGNYQLPV
jgi:hypothetical protein